MKEYVKKTVIAKPNWCVPATLEMVLMHHGITSFPQDMIAQQLEIIPASDNIEHSAWGAKIGQNTINSFFINNHLSLRETYIPINHFFDEYLLVEQLHTILRESNSVICGYNYSWLFGNRDDTYQHVSIIVDVVSSDEEICLLDPGPKDAGYKTVRLTDLYFAIRAANDGLWCIHKNDNQPDSP